VTAGDGGGDFGDVAHLSGEVACHRVDVIGEILPRARHPGNDGLTAELALGADLARDARDFGGEAVELVDHGVDRLLELQDLAAHVHGNLARQVAAGDGSGDLGDVAHLPGEIARHGVHLVGEVLPHATHVLHVGLTAELALGADLTCHTGHFGGESVELVHHGIDGFLQLQDLATHAHGDLARQV